MILYIIAALSIFSIIFINRYLLFKVRERLYPKTYMEDPKYIALKRRYNQNSIYFGPFNSVQHVRNFADRMDITVEIIELKDPDQWSQLNYNDMWTR